MLSPPSQVDATWTYRASWNHHEIPDSTNATRGEERLAWQILFYWRCITSTYILCLVGSFMLEAGRDIPVIEDILCCAEPMATPAYWEVSVTNPRRVEFCLLKMYKSWQAKDTYQGYESIYRAINIPAASCPTLSSASHDCMLQCSGLNCLGKHTFIVGPIIGSRLGVRFEPSICESVFAQ